MSKVRNDPSIAYDTTGPPRDYARKVEYTRQGPHAVARKTEIEKSYSSPIHKTAHTFNQCRVFKLKSFEERKRWLRENNYCYNIAKLQIIMVDSVRLKYNALFVIVINIYQHYILTPMTK